MSKNEMVRFRWEPGEPRVIAPEQQARLDALAADTGEPDTSDIPEAYEAFWRNAVRNPYYRPIKSQLTVRLDADVLAWLRSGGRGYQTKLNAILRRAMLAEVGEGR